jgi:DNA-binding LacI/PurR family transcriptional regulator
VVSIVTSPQVAELAHPALTAMTSPGAALGRIAMEELLGQLEGTGGENRQQLLPCVLEIRGSTGPAAGVLGGDRGLTGSGTPGS